MKKNSKFNPDLSGQHSALEILEPRRLFVAGALDLSFGTAGISTVQIGALNIPRAMTVQKDGKLLIAGTEAATSRFSTFDATLVRLTPTGQLDPTFGAGGKVVVDLGGDDDAFTSVAIQKNGKIVVSGTTDAKGTDDFVIARYNADGSPDLTFGTSGKTITDFGIGTSDTAAAVAVSNAGRIYVAGSTLAPGSLSHDFALVRYNPNGLLDTTYGSGGKVKTDFGSDDNANALALNGDNAVVAGTTTVGGINDNFALAYFDKNGHPLKNFGANGATTTDFQGKSDDATAVLFSSGKIIAGGSSVAANGDRAFALAQYNLHGQLNTHFGAKGKATLDLGTHQEDIAHSMAVVAGGKIVLIGQSRDTSVIGQAPAFAVARFKSNGAADTTFNHLGYVINSFQAGGPATAGAVDPKGRIFATGEVQLSDGTGDEILTAAYLGK